MNIIKKILVSSKAGGGEEMSELASVSSGQLFLKRSPSSPKGELECICNDCVASIRRTSVPFTYRLIIQKLYQEDELDNDDDFPEDDDSSFDNLLKDEWEFVIDEALNFQREGNCISWREINGDFGDRFQLAIDTKLVKPLTIDLFMNTIYRYLYERKYNKDSLDVSDSQLIAEFGPKPEDLYNKFDKNLKFTDSSDDEDEFHDAEEGKRSATIKGVVVYQNQCQLYQFDPATLKFQLCDPKADVLITDHDNFNYSLVTKSPKIFVSCGFSVNMAPTFNLDKLSFIYNSIFDGKSFLLRFYSLGDLKGFQEIFKIALWESSSHSKWQKVNDEDKNYIIHDDDDLIMTDVDDLVEESDDEEELEEIRNRNLRFGKKIDDDDRDESQILKEQFMKASSHRNANLAVGTLSDRTYVSRGDAIGVFKEDDDMDQMKFITGLKNLKTPNGQKFTPAKMKLRLQDKSMLLQDSKMRDHIYNLDLTRGTIVDDYYIKQGVEAVDFTHTSKMDQLTNEQTFVGASNNSLFKVDPRLSGTKLVESEWKKYSTNPKFSAIATTSQKWIALATNGGGIKLYDRLGINAKTLLPDYGAPIIGLDLTKDGKWLLATCETHLYLIDTEIKDGKYAGKSGFEKAFAKDSKPQPIRFTLTPEHMAFLTVKKTKLSFTPARFDIDQNSKEQTIITSTGKYLLTWSLANLLQRKKDYLMQNMQGDIIGDDFKFADSSKMIVMTADDLDLTEKARFKKPTRKSLGIVEEFF